MTLREEIEVGYDRLLQIAMNITNGNSEDASDLVGECVLRALQYESQYQPERGKFFGWLFILMKNNWARINRKAGVEVSLPEVFQEDSGNEIDVQNNMIYNKLVAQLDEKKRAVIVPWSQGYSLQDIATMLDLPIGTVKSRIHYGIQELIERSI